MNFCSIEHENAFIYFKVSFFSVCIEWSILYEKVALKNGEIFFRNWKNFLKKVLMHENSPIGKVEDYIVKIEF